MGKKKNILLEDVTYVDAILEVEEVNGEKVPYLNINDANNPNMCNNQGGTSPPVCLPNLVAIRPQ